MTRLFENVRSTLVHSFASRWALPAAIAIALPLSACGDNAAGTENPDVDAAAGDIDAAADPDASTTGCTTRVLEPGTIPRDQGWLNRGDSIANTTLNSDSIQLVSTGLEFGMISYATGLTPTDAFEVVMRMKVNSVDAHTPLNGGLVLQYHYVSGIGLLADRQDMIYFDTDMVGFGDDEDGTFAVDTSVYNDYRLTFDGATTVTLFVNGESALTRTDVDLAGANLAIGDQAETVALNSDFELEYVNFCTE